MSMGCGPKVTPGSKVVTSAAPSGVCLSLRWQSQGSGYPEYQPLSAAVKPPHHHHHHHHHHHPGITAGPLREGLC